MPLMLSALNGRLTRLRRESWSRGWGPDVTFCINAASAIVLVMGPQWLKRSKFAGGPSALRPWGGLNPTTPQADAGMRIEPPISVPVASGVKPAASAAPEPPDD